MTTLNEQELISPTESATAYCTTCCPTLYVLPDPRTLVCDVVGEGQLSIPTGALNEMTASHRPASLLCCILLGQMMLGASVSSTCTQKRHHAVLPDPSVAEYTTALLPTGNTLLEAKPADNVRDEPAQLSLCETEYATTAEHNPRSVPTVRLLGHVNTGGSESVTVTTKEQAAEFPCPSVTL